MYQKSLFDDLDLNDVKKCGRRKTCRPSRHARPAEPACQRPFSWAAEFVKPPTQKQIAKHSASTRKRNKALLRQPREKYERQHRDRRIEDLLDMPESYLTQAEQSEIDAIIEAGKREIHRVFWGVEIGGKCVECRRLPTNQSRFHHGRCEYCGGQMIDRDVERKALFGLNKKARDAKEHWSPPEMHG
jgi:hypothetical protein